VSIHIIFGPGGAGKSLYQTGEILIRELRMTKRNIGTNLPINIERLAVYMAEKYPNENHRIEERLFILTEKETPYFWRYRGSWKYRLRENAVNQYSDIELVRRDSPHGCVYIIDEAGVCGFSAVAWSSDKESRTAECLFYLDQQRKWGDDSYFSTNGRAPNAIAKGFRDKAHYFIKLKNNRLAQVGPFRGRDNFRWAEYTVEPTPSNGAEAQRTGTFNLDVKGIASCYRTTDGVGVSGGPADIGKRASGIPIMWVFPLMIAVASLIIAVPWALGRGTQKVMEAKTRDSITDASKKIAAATSTDGMHVSPGGSRALNNSAPESPAEVWANGWVTRGDVVMVNLSDGGMLYGSTRDLVRTHTRVLDRATGKAYRLKLAVPRQTPSAGGLEPMRSKSGAGPVPGAQTPMVARSTDFPAQDSRSVVPPVPGVDVPGQGGYFPPHMLTGGRK